MAILNWLLRIVVFLLLLGLAARNSDPVTVRWFFGHEWRIELSVLLLALFVLGVLLGAFAGWAHARKPSSPTPSSAD
ncbi:lipopolysaccharide assembly LapA domain-containing protein [Methyloversatilis sp.]|uniref:LapA family protein n=1 Tax=Methyloversatilis sp. TaxID=2569862 RepID=UPI00273767E1|nr:lipopolysaccharide assembly protein LapA domain-containing protein [Methyloversatilis sp.]MDP2868517.1 lipopolysaccharide assembly protein LapA domain-containing protein [Methyloversatilis sp.]MDP3287425.1 lipopolysaccharide assembly protein LapA domain-containing protein [Methyloversatilis sp.]MDP3455872.1 lipopolysaccharide assembly protein LapA domain-containing protein [Methyloversatilis sp.]MDP3577684.1 lipopolysaccharide assembly protein LapA domain-containing protein [Methyloversatili